MGSEAKTPSPLFIRHVVLGRLINLLSLAFLVCKIGIIITQIS